MRFITLKLPLIVVLYYSFPFYNALSMGFPLPNISFVVESSGSIDYAIAVDLIFGGLVSPVAYNSIV